MLCAVDICVRVCLFPWGSNYVNYTYFGAQSIQLGPEIIYLEAWGSGGVTHNHPQHMLLKNVSVYRVA